jgi:hypothetical protein
MYRVLPERAAEKNLSWLTTEIRVVRINRVRHRREVYR